MDDDVLSEVLGSMHLEGAVYFCDQVQTPWKKVFADDSAASFHQVRRGGCRLQIGERVDFLGPGDLLFVAPGTPHVLSGQAQDGTPEPPTLLLCGYCSFSIDPTSPLGSLFPSVQVLRQEAIDQSPWLRATLDQLAAEYLSARPGAQLVIRKLTEVLIVELIRASYGKREETGYLRALNDRQVGRALQLLHQHPQRSWTIETLAREVASSRTHLARRFTSLVGQPVFEYLTNLRIQRAKELLDDVGTPLHEVAAAVGYRSEVAFVKAFKKRTGGTPRSYQRSRRATP